MVLYAIFILLRILLVDYSAILIYYTIIRGPDLYTITVICLKLMYIQSVHLAEKYRLKNFWFLADLSEMFYDHTL